jgi:hypothetical protein
MCHGDPGLQTLLRDTEARMAPFVRAMNESRQPVPVSAGWMARLRAVLAGWMRKEIRHV